MNCLQLQLEDSKIKRKQALAEFLKNKYPFGLSLNGAQAVRMIDKLLNLAQADSQNPN